MYIEGYKESVEIIKSAVERTRGNNAIVYPLAFLCRHAVELGLKESILEACRLSGREPARGIHERHELDYLTEKLKDAYPKVEEDTQWGNVQRFLQTWESADPRGEFTRYRLNTGGKTVEVDGNVYVGRIIQKSLECLDFFEGLLTEIEMEDSASHESSTQ